MFSVQCVRFGLIRLMCVQRVDRVALSSVELGLSYNNKALDRMLLSGAFA
jgi:hypothetical protein